MSHKEECCPPLWSKGLRLRADPASTSLSLVANFCTWFTQLFLVLQQTFCNKANNLYKTFLFLLMNSAVNAETGIKCGQLLCL